VARDPESGVTFAERDSAGMNSSTRFLGPPDDLVKYSPNELHRRAVCGQDPHERADEARGGRPAKESIPLDQNGPNTVARRRDGGCKSSRSAAHHRNFLIGSNWNIHCWQQNMSIHGASHQPSPYCSFDSPAGPSAQKAGKK
jgi:hypothetical protein